MTQELTGSGSARVHDASRSQMGGGRLGGRLQRPSPRARQQGWTSPRCRWVQVVSTTLTLAVAVTGGPRPPRRWTVTTCSSGELDLAGWGEPSVVAHADGLGHVVGDGASAVGHAHAFGEDLHLVAVRMILRGLPPEFDVPLRADAGLGRGGVPLQHFHAPAHRAPPDGLIPVIRGWWTFPGACR